MKKYKVGPVKIKYKRKVYWFQQEEDGHGPVSPTDHCDRNGNLDYSKCFLSPAFAHVQDNRKMSRFGEFIGVVDDYIV